MGVGRVRLIVGVAVLGFLLALVLGSAGLFGGGRALGSATTISVIGGDVLVRHGASGTFVAAVDGEVLTSGDAIRTGTDSRAVLTYFEGSTVTIEPETDLSIDEAFAAQGSTRIQMTQNAGRTWHVVTKLVNGNSKYDVRTPASTASVRGTAFEVNTVGTHTTIGTTEGTVVSQVPDPVQPGATIDVPVPAGNQQTQEVNAPPAPIKLAPPPERKVTVTVEATNSVVVDPLGRANGVTKDGKIVIQTPGAKVKVENGTVVIEMPDLPDGKIATRVDKEKDTTKSSDDVKVTTTIAEKGKSDVVVADVAKRDQDKKGTTGIEIKKDDTGATKSRALGGDEVKVLPSAKTAGVDLIGALTGNRDGGKTAEPSSTERAKETKGPDAGTTQGNTREAQNADKTVPKKDTTDVGDKANPTTDTKNATTPADTSGETKGTSDLTSDTSGRNIRDSSGKPVDTTGQNSSDPKKEDKKDDTGPKAPASPPTNFVPDFRLPNPLDQQQKEQQLREQQQKADQQKADQEKQKADQEKQKADQQKADQQKADQEKQKADQEKQKADQEKQKADQQKADQLLKEQQQKDAEKAAAERAAAERAAAERAAAERAAAERAAAERAAEQRAAEQRAAEQRAAEQRAAEQRAAEQRAAEELLRLRNHTPPGQQQNGH